MNDRETWRERVRDIHASRTWWWWWWCGWLTEDLTDDRGKWINSNSGFIEQILHKRCMGVEITVVVSCHCSLCWVSKLYVVENLRLNCLLVCGDSTSRRWGWSQCLVQILGVVVRSGCRCCWRQSMIWMHWLQKQDDWCRSWAVLWLTGGGVSKWPWSVGACPSSELLMD